MVFKEAGSSSYSLPPYPREDTPLLTNSPPLSSQFKTCANIFISIVGAGVLGLPYTFKTTGYTTGLTPFVPLGLFSISIRVEFYSDFDSFSPFEYFC
jgi:proton-coupled amino acid transporter